MKKINLVHVTSSLGIGGAETILCDLIKNLDGKRFNQSVVYFHDGPHVEHLKDAGIPLYKIKGLLCLYDPLFWWRFIRTLKRIKPDCLHSLLWSANFAVRIVGNFLSIPFVNALHNEKGLNGTLRCTLDKITQNFGSRYIAVSQAVAQSMDWIPATKIEVIPNGIDPESLLIKGMRYKKTRYELELSDEQFIIGTVGRLHPIKRFDLLLKSFALINMQFPLTRLIIVGSGPQEEYLKKLAARLGIDQDVIFVAGDPYGYYPLFDCFILPSKLEGISVALLEACAFSLPCVVTHSGLHPVIENDHDGLLCADHPEAIAQSIGVLIQNKEYRSRLGHNGYKKVTHAFKNQAMAQQYATVFTQLVEEKSD